MTQTRAFETAIPPKPLRATKTELSQSESVVPEKVKVVRKRGKERRRMIQSGRVGRSENKPMARKVKPMMASLRPRMQPIV